jgi:hypothetical protein
VGSLTSHHLIGLNGLLRGQLFIVNINVDIDFHVLERPCRLWFLFQDLIKDLQWFLRPSGGSSAQTLIQLSSGLLTVIYLVLSLYASHYAFLDFLIFCYNHADMTVVHVGTSLSPSFISEIWFAKNSLKAMAFLVTSHTHF